MRDGMITNEFGTEYWYLNDKLHRTDGPAAIFTNGTQHWYVDDQLHRVDGPAIIRGDGSQFWYINNQCHRTDGPAIISTDGSCRWYLNGTNITEDVNQWMTDLDITYPFDEEHQALFVLTFGGK